MNILVITVDTLRWDHLAHNRRQPVFTPNLDRLARRATIFDRAIINSFPTVPHRMDCFTGHICFPKYDWEKMPAEYTTLTEALTGAGYFAATVADTTNFINADITRGMNEIHVMHQVPESNPKPADIPFPVPPEHIRQEGRQRQRQLADMAHFRHEGDWFVAQTMKRAADWLQDNAQRDKWFLWVDTFEVHEVWHTPQYYLDLYDPGYEGPDYDFPNYGYTDIYTKAQIKHLQAHYAAEVTLTDRWIGHLLDQLDVMQLWDSTMVVLTADHGMYLGEHNRMGKHTVKGYADPWPLYEEITHVPMLVWVPGLKKAKKRVKALVQPADLMPTILDAAGAAGPPMDGRSWIPLIAGDRKRNGGVVYSAKHSAPNAKLPICVSWLTATTDRWTYIAAQADHAAELYDIRKDPGQQHNVADKHPARVKRMQKDVIAFLREKGAAEDYVDKFRVKP